MIFFHSESKLLLSLFFLFYFFFFLGGGGGVGGGGLGEGVDLVIFCFTKNPNLIKKTFFGEGGGGEGEREWG